MSDEWIPLSVPQMTGNEWGYVKNCLDTGWVSSVGSYVNQFEASVASYVDAPYAVAATCGTAALHTALLIAGVQPQDEVLVSDLTFIAPVNAIRYAGAWPVLIDVEPDYWQMDVTAVRRFLFEDAEIKNGVTYNRTTGRRISAIIPVHVLGHPVDLQPLHDLAKEYNLSVIEDAAESLGAEYRGKKIGSWSDITCFSFNGNKTITTGGGGIIATRKKEWADKARYLTTQAKDHSEEYIHHEIGYNYRMTNVLAAIGCAQMEKADTYIDKKRKIAATYTEAFSGSKHVRFMKEASWAKSTFWLCTVLVDSPNTDARKLIQHLASHKIQSRPLWQPIHLSPAHPDAVRIPCPVSEMLYAKAVSLPSSVSLTEEEQKRVIECVQNFF